MGETKRFAVHYFHNPIDDIDLLRTGFTEYFSTEKEALEFKEKWTHKGKPFYWQPTIWKEEIVIKETKGWREVKPTVCNQKMED